MWHPLSSNSLDRWMNRILSMRILPDTIENMWHTIHFRSNMSSLQGGVGSLQKIRSRGIEYESIRPATPTDDARDIAWKQSARSDTLSVKSREDTRRLEIMLIGISDISWELTLDAWDDKYSFYTRIADASRQTSHTSGYTYTENKYTHMGIWEVSSLLKKRKIKNTLILFVTSQLESSEYTELISLWRQNDIVVMHLLHPFEEHPEKYPHILTESQSIDYKKYLDDLALATNSIKTLLSQQNISFLPASSKDNPTELLNHFFKNRYAH